MSRLAPYENQFDNEKRKALFAVAVRELRKANQLTQKEAANALGIGQPTYNSYENGRSEPSLEMLVRMSYLFKCSVDDLLQKSNLIGDTDQQAAKVKEYADEIRELRKNEKVQKSESLQKTLDKLMDFIDVISEKLKDQD